MAADKLVEPAVDGARSDHRQIDGIRHEAEQRDRGRVTVDQTRGVKKIRNSYLMGRQPVPHRIHDICAVEPDQCSRRVVGAHGIDQDHVVRIRQQTQKRKTKRSAVFQSDARRDAVVALHAGDCGGAKPVIAEQDIAQSQDENVNRLVCGLWPRLRCSRASAFRSGMNL